MTRERFEELNKQYSFRYSMKGKEEIFFLDKIKKVSDLPSNIHEECKSNKPQIITFLKEDIAKKKEEAHLEFLQNTEEAAKLQISGFVYTIGCDAADDYFFKYESENSKAIDIRRHADAQLAETCKKILFKNKDLAKKLNGEYQEAHLYTYGGWIFGKESANQLAQMGKEKIAEEDKIKEAKKQEAEEKKQAIFAKAKETGERQVLRSFAIDCQDPEEDCSIDTVTIYAMPDGSEKEAIGHNW